LLRGALLEDCKQEWNSDTKVSEMSGIHQDLH